MSIFCYFYIQASSFQHKDDWETDEIKYYERKCLIYYISDDYPLVMTYERHKEKEEAERM